MRTSRIYRLLRLITILQSGQSQSVDELAAELEVSRRTVFRDLNMLELAHIPYYFDRQRNGYRINSHFFLPPVNLTLGEALALMVLTTRQRSAARMPWSDTAARAALKLESVLPTAVREHVGSVLAKLQIHMTPSSRHDGLDDMLDELTGALAGRKVCRLVYVSFYDRKQIRVTVHPLRLVFVRRAWYLLAWSVSHGEVRTFKVGRIKSITVQDKTFTPPDAKLLDEHFGQAWAMIPEGKRYDIHLRFAADVAGNVAEVQWHPSQQVEFRDDGSLDFRVNVDGLGEITWWILGYGDRVRVLAPTELAGRVRDVAQRMLKLYRGRRGRV